MAEMIGASRTGMWALGLVVLLMSVACAVPAREGPRSAAKPGPARKPPCKCEIAQVLDAFHRAAARADEAAYFSAFAPEGTFLGTDASERWGVATFRAYAHPYFAAGKGWTYVPRDRHVSFADDASVAWFDELLDNEKYGVLRGSGVLVKRDGAWKIAQYNLTFTVPNDVSAQVVPLLRGTGAAP
jgi:hypothetical protein